MLLATSISILSLMVNCCFVFSLWMNINPPCPSRKKTMTVANSVSFPFTWESVPMQTFSLKPAAVSRLIAFSTAFRMGISIGSPLNFLHLIKKEVFLRYRKTSELQRGTDYVRRGGREKALIDERIYRSIAENCPKTGSDTYLRSGPACSRCLCHLPVFL